MPPGVFFPVRTLYVEPGTLRIAQHVFTEDLWRKACRNWSKSTGCAKVLEQIEKWPSAPAESSGTP